MRELTPSEWPVLGLGGPKTYSILRFDIITEHYEERKLTSLPKYVTKKKIKSFAPLCYGFIFLGTTGIGLVIRGSVSFNVIWGWGK